jgi:hypothetical protein
MSADPGFDPAFDPGFRGEIAAYYARYRRGYPGAVVDAIAAPSISAPPTRSWTSAAAPASSACRWPPAPAP